MPLRGRDSKLAFVQHCHLRLSLRRHHGRGHWLPVLTLPRHRTRQMKRRAASRLSDLSVEEALGSLVAAEHPHRDHGPVATHETIDSEAFHCGQGIVSMT